MKNPRFFLALLAGTFAMSCTVRREGAELKTPSGIRGVGSYAGIIKQLQDTVGGSDFVTFGSMGQSAEGRDFAYLEVKNKQFIGGSRPVVLITEAIHGDEYLNISDRLVEGFVKDIDSNTSNAVKSFVTAGGIILVVPVMNPDGFEANRRGDIHNLDLNRDFPLQDEKGAVRREGKQSVEIASFADLLERRIKQPKNRLLFALDYHCCKGAVLMPWAYDERRPINNDKQVHFDGMEDLVKLHHQYQFGKTYPLLGYRDDGMMNDYLFQNYGTIALVFEGLAKMEDGRLQKHTDFWAAAFTYINKNFLGLSTPVVGKPPTPQPPPQPIPPKPPKPVVPTPPAWTPDQPSDYINKYFSAQILDKNIYCRLRNGKEGLIEYLGVASAQEIKATGLSSGLYVKYRLAGEAGGSNWLPMTADHARLLVYGAVKFDAAQLVKILNFTFSAGPNAGSAFGINMCGIR